MRRISRFVATVLLLAVPALGSAQNQAVAPPVAGALSLDAHKTALAPITYENLTIMPVVSSAAPAAPSYLVLDEGMKAGKVRVIETGDG
ncbi:MAG TPA: DUF6569 family protein, partial [Haliangium sp.]|nr:DUF6569 family protein [Haliangium sp.]